MSSLKILLFNKSRVESYSEFHGKINIGTSSELLSPAHLEIVKKTNTISPLWSSLHMPPTLVHKT